MEENLCHDFGRVMEIKDGIDVHASSSSSLNYLPNDIIHQILSFLSDRKEVAKASILSKSWQDACSSHPVLEFRGTCCFLRGRRRRWGKLFIKFVDNTMNRFDNGWTEIRKFKLDTQLVDINVETLTLLLDKWITIALQKSQCLDLTVKVRHREFKQWTYEIPVAVLSSGSIQSLSLGFQVSLPSRFFSYPDDLLIKLSLLRNLEIYQASNIGNKEFQRLFQVCPFIENLTVDSSFISEIKASDLVNLEVIDITTYVCQEDAVKIEAPSVKTLRLHSTVNDSQTRDIDVDCPNLKYLKLKDGHKSSEWFHGFLSKFPLLETLELCECITLKWIKIENPRVKKVDLYQCQNLSHVEIHSPKLFTFQYRVISWCTVPSITVDNPKILHSGADFSFLGSYHLNPSWFLTLRGMLQVASFRRSLSIKLNWVCSRNSISITFVTLLYLLSCDLVLVETAEDGRVCERKRVVATEYISM